jgi:hypothetical protein
MARVVPRWPFTVLAGIGDDNERPYVLQVDEDGALITSGGGGAVDASVVTYTPETLSDWDGGVDPGNQNNVDDQLAERVKDIETLLPYSPYPTRARIFANELTVLTGTALTAIVDASQLFQARWYQGTPANGDQLTWSWLLRVGTYTLYQLGVTSNTLGIQDIATKEADESVFSDQITGIDWYTAGQIANQVKTGTITIGTSGLVIFRSTINGKNASSTNYYLSLTQLWIKPTTD